MIIITIGGNRQPKYNSLPDRGWEPMFKPTIYGEGTMGWFKNKRHVYYYRCNEWRGGDGWRTDCDFKGREDSFIAHMMGFHDCTEEEAREYIKTPYNLKNWDKAKS